MNSIIQIPANFSIPIITGPVVTVIVDGHELTTNSYVDLDKIASWAQMSHHLDLKSDGAWNNVAFWKEAKAKLALPILNNDGSFDKYINVQIHAYQGKTWAGCLLKLGDALAKREGILIDGKDKHLASVFPGGYVVINHLVKKAGVASVRKDTYIYGHPSGERYRSMTDFAVHYAHLVLDYNGPDGAKTKNCECTLCVKSKSTAVATKTE